MRELDFSIDLILRAGEIALKYHGNSPQFWEKAEGQGRVSVADLEVDAFICDALKEAFPEDALLSEEREDDESRFLSKRQWVIDPIDGTESFLNAHDDFAISLALVEDEQPILGVIYAPKHKRLFSALKSHGAYENGQIIRATNENDLSKALFLASGARYNRPLIHKEPRLRHEFRASLALRLALVAAGEFDGTFALRPTWEWDIAAGKLIVEEAGAILRDQFGALPKFNQKHPQLNGMIAGSAEMVQELVKRLI